MSDYSPAPSSLPPGSLVSTYLRDSGGTGQELSILQQKNEVAEYCERHGLVLKEFYIDQARTGTTDVGRDDFHRMVNVFAQPNLRPDGLILWNLARFARDATDAAYYKAIFRKAGITIHSMTDPIPDGDFSLAIEALIDTVNQEKSRQTARDVKRALHSLARQGYSTGGTPPRCYIAEKVEISKRRDGTPRIVSRWIPNPELWELGKQAWELRAKGYSYAQIQEETQGKIYTTKNSWSTFFANESYLGIGKVGEERIPNHHEALVDQKTWDAVQKLRRPYQKKEKKQIDQHPRAIHQPSLLTSMIYCAECGSAMIHRNDGSSDWRSYACGRKNRRGARSCASRMVNARNIEIIILHIVLDQILTPDYFYSLQKSLQDRISNVDEIIAQEKVAQKELHKLNQAINNLLDAIEIQGTSSVRGRLEEREKEKKVLLGKLDMLKEKRTMASLSITPESLEVILKEWKNQVIEKLEVGNIIAARNILKSFILRIDASYTKIKIQYSYPLNNTHRDKAGVQLEDISLDIKKSNITDKEIHSIIELVPHLQKAPRKKSPWSPSPRDREIYQRHTEEKRTVRDLALEYKLSEKSIWGICTHVRKYIENIERDIPARDD